MKLKMKYNMHTVQKGDSFLVGQKGREKIHYRIPRIVDRGYVKQYLKIMIFEYQHCLLQNYCVILHTIKLG